MTTTTTASTTATVGRSRGFASLSAAMFKSFYGHDPDIGPLIEYRGLTMPGDAKTAAAAGAGH